jgi:hypothetical protein
MSPEHRRLAAVLAADVVGYSRLMGRDESGSLRDPLRTTMYQQLVVANMYKGDKGRGFRVCDAAQRERFNVFRRIAAGLEGPAAADAIR